MADDGKTEQIAMPGIVATTPWGSAESPIERRFLDALLASGYFQATPAASDLVVATGPLGLVLRQLPVTVSGRRYRLDFAIVDNDGAPWIAVEADGWAYHASKEQQVSDRQRERALTAAGWIVLRFAGGEIHRDAAGCVAEVLRLLERRRSEVG